MNNQSLRQLAKQLGVSHSYLSQVKHGKRPASSKVVSKMVSIFPSETPRIDAVDTKPCYTTQGGVPELADGLDLGSSAAMRGGSSPPFPTTEYEKRLVWHVWLVKKRLI